jgi:hypothetical protein
MLLIDGGQIRQGKTEKKIVSGPGLGPNKKIP